MDKVKVWYVLSYCDKEWTIWKHKEAERSGGIVGVFTSPSKKECLDYCKKNKIELGKRKVKICQN